MDKKPNATSSDHDAMAPYWKMVETMMGGVRAMREVKDYLPKFPQERDQDYEFRRKSAKFTNIFRDIVENLAQRPFGKQVKLEDDALPSEIEEFQEDVDGQSNHLHVFAGEVFFAGIARAVDWILVDYTADVPENATRAVEREIGARPYWVRIPASSMLAVYSDMIGGREEFVHARFLEPHVEREGWSEKTAKRVRVLNREPLEGGGYAPATFAVWEERRNEQTKESEWVVVVPETPISIGVIPLVPFITGRRLGSSWRFHPPMRDAAELQIEHYQQESALKHIKSLTAFPMLAGNGVSPAMGDDGKPMPVPVGPQSVLYAPPNGESGSHGEWTFIEPSAESMKFLAEDIKETARELRELGRQPLTAQSGNLTVVTTAFAAQKGNAAIQAWAINLKDALERAFDLTARWLGIEFDPNVIVDTDFDLGLGDDESFAHVLTLRRNNDISREAEIHEAKRRGILDADYDGDADAAKILDDLIGDEGEDKEGAAQTPPLAAE